MTIEVNWFSVLAAAVSSMVVGSIWYAKPVFGTIWQKQVKLTDAQMKKGATKALTGAFLLAIIAAYVLAHVTQLSQAFFGYTPVVAALSTAFWLWLGISMTTIVIHALFEQRNTTLTILHVANQLVTMLVMGLVIGLLQ
ncbi:MAG: DUF1761 domain-containing protein [Candidatus Andersenbacteria bacterium]|nr:DUF1761 domain-containing protein [Candidatus Andersenbacteria bacterium]MBI3251232.1 DUF1761 domain-containing protein [Candidatus Andersenbacteria bacterium]